MRSVPVLLILAMACAATRPVSDDAPLGCDGKSHEPVREVALVQLLIRPSRYDGCFVDTKGFIESHENGAQIYVSREDLLLRGDLFGAIHIDLRGLKDKSITFGTVNRATGNVVRVRGIFRSAGLPRFDEIEELRLNAAMGLSFPGELEVK